MATDLEVKRIEELNDLPSFDDAYGVSEKSGIGYRFAMNDIVSARLPVGSMTMFAAATAPDGYLLCNGSAVSRSTYSALFAVVGTTWGVGDGSTTFNLPDMRGAAPAGAGTSTGYTQNETLALGTKYNDQLQGFDVNIKGSLPTGGLDNVIERTVTGSSFDFPTTSVTGNTQLDDNGNGTPRTGNVTRGKVVGVNFIIRYV